MSITPNKWKRQEISGQNANAWVMISIVGGILVGGLLLFYMLIIHPAQQTPTPDPAPLADTSTQTIEQPPTTQQTSNNNANNLERNDTPAQLTHRRPPQPSTPNPQQQLPRTAQQQTTTTPRQRTPTAPAPRPAPPKPNPILTANTLLVKSKQIDQNLLTLLNNAHARGVEIRAITEQKGIQAPFQILSVSPGTISKDQILVNGEKWIDLPL